MTLQSTCTATWSLLESTSVSLRPHTRPSLRMQMMRLISIRTHQRSSSSSLPTQITRTWSLELILTKVKDSVIPFLMRRLQMLTWNSILRVRLKIKSWNNSNTSIFQRLWETPTCTTGRFQDLDLTYLFQWFTNLACQLPVTPKPLMILTITLRK
jgi:hypothetical protein